VRKYFRSATAPKGVPPEYTGIGLEKLPGFLITVVFQSARPGFYSRV